MPWTDNWIITGLRGISDPYPPANILLVDAAQHRDQGLQRVQRDWDDTHISPRCCPSAGVKLCTYHRWFSRPNPQVTEPYFELPLTQLRSIVQVSVEFPFPSH